MADAHASRKAIRASAFNQELRAAEPEAMVEAAKPECGIATAEAQGRRYVAKEKCDVLSGVDDAVSERFTPIKNHFVLGCRGVQMPGL